MRTNTAIFVNCRINFLSVELDAFSREGIELYHTPDTKQTLELLHRQKVDVLIIEQAEFNGKLLDTIHELKRIQPDVSIIVCHSESCSESISEMLVEDIFDYIPLPIDFKFLLRKIKQAIELGQLITENRRLTRLTRSTTKTLPRNSIRKDGAGPELNSTTPLLVGQSEAMLRVQRMVADVAPSDMTVLLRGETGTGKDVVARCIHNLSCKGASKPFIKICCPAVPELLLESELFGHEPGAFTGANTQKPGRLELAAGGTVFLDEIAEMPVTVQSKLLEALEHRQFTRLGGHEPIKIDARFIAATNAPLERMLETGQFRQDLYFRLNQFTIQMPSLRDRVEDVPLLVDFFLKKYGNLYECEGLCLSAKAMAEFIQYPWPGNVRELESGIRRFALTGREETAISMGLEQTPVNKNWASDGIYHTGEKRVIMSALTAAKWNRRQAAVNLGISYSTLRRRIERYKLNELAFTISDFSEKFNAFEPNQLSFEILDSAGNIPNKLS